MDRDRPPFGPSDDADVPRMSGRPGRDDRTPTATGGDRDNGRPRHAGRDRATPRLPVEPTFGDEAGADGADRSLDRMGRFSRRDSTPGERREPVLGTGHDRSAGVADGREEPRLTSLGSRRGPGERPAGPESPDDRSHSERDRRLQPPLRSRERASDQAPTASGSAREPNRFLFGDRAKSERPPFDPRASSMSRDREAARPVTPPAANEPRATPPRPATGDRSWRADLAARARETAVERTARQNPMPTEGPEPAAPARERPSFVERGRYSMRLPERFAGGKPESEAVEPNLEAPEVAAPEYPDAPLPELVPEEGERQSKPKRDWRSLRFSSRFAQPPKAYDLDEVGDGDVSFDDDSGRDTGPAPTPQYPAAPQYAPSPDYDDGAMEEEARARRSFRRARPTRREPEPDYEAAAEPDRAFADDRLPSEPSYDEAGAEVARADDVPGYGEPDEYDDGYGADTYREPMADGSAEPFRYAAEEYAGDHVASEFGPDPYPEATEAAEPVDPRRRSRSSRARDQHVYDDFDIRDRGEATVGGAVDEGLDDFGPYGDDPAPLHAALDAEPASYRGTFEDYEKKGRRAPLVLLVALGGVAVVAGGVIFGYQLLTADPSDEVPLVKVEGTPSKVAPDDPGGMDIPHQNKLIYDRILGEVSPVEEQIVPREEPVIDMNSGSPNQETEQAGNYGTVLPEPPEAPEDELARVDDTGRQEAADILRGNSFDNGQLSQTFGVPVPPPGFTPSGDAVDQSDEAAAAATPAMVPDDPDATPTPTRVVETVSPPEPAPTARPEPPLPKIKPAVPDEPVEVAVQSRQSPGPIQLAPLPGASDQLAAAPSTAVETAPLSQPTGILTPPEPAPVRQPAREVARVAPAPAPAATTGAGGYVIQTAAFRSEEEAQDEYRKLRDKHGSLIASYGPLIQKADLGSRGIYYRLRLGPIDSKGTASNLCDSLLAAGEKDCLVRQQ